MNKHLRRRSAALSAIVVLMALCGCAGTEPVGGADAAGGDVDAAVRDVDATVRNVDAAVREMMSALARDLAADGPAAWLGYFADDPEFFMASDGAAVFPDLATARAFVTEFDATVASMELNWGELSVDVINADIALLSAPYDEVIVDAGGKRTSFNGFFTGTAMRTEAGWRLKSLHWSSPREDDADSAHT